MNFIICVDLDQFLTVRNISNIICKNGITFFCYYRIKRYEYIKVVPREIYNLTQLRLLSLSYIMTNMHPNIINMQLLEVLYIIGCNLNTIKPIILLSNIRKVYINTSVYYNTHEIKLLNTINIYYNPDVKDRINKIFNT